VSEEGLISLVEYIRHLDSNYRVQQTLNASDDQTGPTGDAPASSASGMVKQ
jgi:cytochrome c oxidase subunit 2